MLRVAVSTHGRPAQDRILLLDSYFNVVVFYGITIWNWMQARAQHTQTLSGAKLR